MTLLQQLHKACNIPTHAAKLLQEPGSISGSQINQLLSSTRCCTFHHQISPRWIMKVRQPACYCILHIIMPLEYSFYVVSWVNAHKKISQETTHLVSVQRAEMITLAKLSEPSSPFSWRKTFMQRSISFSCSSQTGTVTASCFKRSTCLISLLFISAA